MTPRATFLRALPRHGFAPPEADVAALGVALPVTPAEAALRFAAEVRRFAAEFWELAPADRAARWHDLAARATGSAAVWLRELEPGLDVVPVGHTDPGAAELAALVRELFVLPPRTRAARRNRWLMDNAPHLSALAAGPTHDTDAGLEPRLFEWLAAGAAPGRIAHGTWVRGRRHWRKEERPGEREFRRVMIPLGLVGWAVLITLVVMNHRNSSGDPTTTHSLFAPATRPAPPQFTEVEVARFWFYEHHRAAHPVPDRYHLWVESGRPHGVRAP